jgi:hypothetical protein
MRPHSADPYRLTRVTRSGTFDLTRIRSAARRRSPPHWRHLLLSMRGSPLRTRPMNAHEGKAPRQHESGRRCRSCGSGLSRYNGSAFCYPHQPVKYPFLKRPV